jgi:hypothetical protein
LAAAPGPSSAGELRRALGQIGELQARQQAAGRLPAALLSRQALQQVARLLAPIQLQQLLRQHHFQINAVRLLLQRLTQQFDGLLLATALPERFDLFPDQIARASGAAPTGR